MDITRPYFETVTNAVQEILGADQSIRTKYVSDKPIETTLYHCYFVRSWTLRGLQRKCREKST